MVHGFDFQKMIKEGRPLVGMFQTLNSPEVTEILALSGLDWIFVDLEHSPLDVAAAQRLLQAAGASCPCVIRSPCHEEVWLKKILDIGPAGIVVPRVNSAEEAARIVGCCKYPPEGNRSVGLCRAHKYGMGFQDYIGTANQTIAVILQIEDIEGVRNIDSILKVRGIDALFIGPYDLSGSMGKIGQVNDPEVQQQIQTVRRKCMEAGMPLGIFTADPEKVKPLIEEGYTVIALGIETMFLGQALKQALRVIR